MVWITTREINSSGWAQSNELIRKEHSSEILIFVRTLEDLEPVRLVIVFRSEYAGVEQDKNDHDPVEVLRLGCSAKHLTTSPIQFVQFLPAPIDKSYESEICWIKHCQ